MKRQALSYQFLEYLYEKPTDPYELIEELKRTESDASGKVGRLFEGAKKGDVLELMNERMRAVCRSSITVWWYLFWVSVVQGLVGRMLI